MLNIFPSLPDPFTLRGLTPSPEQKSVWASHLSFFDFFFFVAISLVFPRSDTEGGYISVSGTSFLLKLGFVVFDECRRVFLNVGDRFFRVTHAGKLRFES